MWTTSGLAEQWCIKWNRLTFSPRNNLGAVSLNQPYTNASISSSFMMQSKALCSNDVKSCYDQITLLMATLCLCQFGSSMTMVDSMITILYEMEHHIRSTFGDLMTHASCCTWQALIAGIGQGNSASPQIWAAVSSPMLDIMWTDGFYAHLMTAISGMDKKLVSFAFIDDMDLCAYSPHITSPNIQNEMQQSVDHWEGLLRATGGTLVPTKCFWYLINFKHTNNTWHYITKTQKPGEIAIQDDHCQQVEIPRLEAREARWTLGVWIAPGGNWDTEVDYLLSVTSDWKVCMAASHLTPTDATFSL